MIVLEGGRCVGNPFGENHIPGCSAQSVVSTCHELGRWDLVSGGEGGVEDEGEASEGCLEGGGEVDQGGDW